MGRITALRPGLAGLLEETTTSDNARGRPTVNSRLATERVQVIGVEIDATTVRG